MNKNKTLLIVVILALILGGAYFLYGKLGSQVENENIVTENTNTDETNDTTEENEDDKTVAAPDFTVTDKDGNEVKLSDFEGKPAIVNFWASWCGLCVAEMPEFEDAYKKYGEDIHFLMVNMTDGRQETLESANEFLDSTDYTFPVFYDTEMSAAITYGVTGLPVTYFIDAEGNLIAKAISTVNTKTMEKGIELITK